jgi:hypothetical protein
MALPDPMINLQDLTHTTHIPASKQASVSVKDARADYSAAEMHAALDIKISESRQRHRDHK